MFSLPSEFNSLSAGYWLFGLSSLVLLFVSVVPHTKSVRLLSFLAWAATGLTILSYYIVWELTGAGFNQSIPYHLHFGLDGGSVTEFQELQIVAGVGVALLAVIFVCYHWLIVKDHHTRHCYYVAPTLLVLLVAAQPLWSEIYDTYAEREASPIPFEDHYAKPTLTGGDPAKYPNVVWIYAESFERTYLNETLFPGLCPELSKLERESLTCTDVRQVYATHWTIAGFVSSQCGIPLVTMGIEGNALDRMNNFLPGARGMCDLLKEKGYRAEFVMGVDSSFAGTGKFLTSHGLDVVDLAPILQKRPEYEKDIEGWGLPDDQTFDVAKERYGELLKEKKPFVLMVSTIDTHHPYGRIAPSVQKVYGDGGNSSLNAIHVGDHLIGEFVRAIRSMDVEDKTLIVITSDHLAMPNTAYDKLTSVERRNLLTYNWPGKIQPKTIDRPACSFDKGITALHLMGFDSTALGLGRSLVGDEKTFVETFPDPNRQLMGWEGRVLEFWR